MHDKDPITATKAQLAAMSDNEDVLESHPDESPISPPSNKRAEFGLDLSEDSDGAKMDRLKEFQARKW